MSKMTFVLRNNHSIWMLIGCILPLLLIFIAPVIDLNGNVSLFIFILAMFAGHLLVLHSGHQERENMITKIENYEYPEY